MPDLIGDISPVPLLTKIPYSILSVPIAVVLTLVAVEAFPVTLYNSCIQAAYVRNLPVLQIEWNYELHLAVSKVDSYSLLPWGY